MFQIKQELNPSVFNMIKGINESNTLTKHISCECKSRFDGKCNSYQWQYNGKCWCECKKCHTCEKDYVYNLSTWNCENGRYLASIMDDSVILYDEIRESYDEVAEAKSYNKTNSNEKKQAKFLYFIHYFIQFLFY